MTISEVLMLRALVMRGRASTTSRYTRLLSHCDRKSVRESREGIFVVEAG